MASTAKLEDKKNSKSFPSNAIYHEINNEVEFIEESIEFIESTIDRDLLTQVIILIPWLPQFDSKELELLAKIESKSNVTFVGLTVLSEKTLGGENLGQNRYQHEEFFSSRRSRLMWVSDIPTGTYQDVDWIRKMPDYAETAIVSTKPKVFDLSFFGLLSPYRGLFEILVIALFNPRLKVQIKGYGFASHRIFRPWKKPIFRYGSWRQNLFLSLIFSGISLIVSGIRFLPNVHFSTTPFDTESDLDAGMSETRAIFYCPKLPHGSGLTNKSLSAGIPLLWHGWEGVAFTLLSERFPAGYFRYPDIFVPGRFQRRLASLPTPDSMQLEMRRNFVGEILELEKFL